MKSRGTQTILSDPAMVVALGILVFLVLAALVGPVVVGIDPDKIGNEQLAAPSWSHWCGTDFLGRDILVRTLDGARISLWVGCVGAGVSLVIGVSYGTTAAYMGGRMDNLMMRAVDILYSLPSLIFVMVLITVLEKPISHLLAAVNGPQWLAQQTRMVLLFVGLGCLEWLIMARVVRGQVLVLREMQFVQAAKVMGLGGGKILWRHLLPNLIGLVIIYLTLSIPAVILQESFLSFLGLGVQAPSASLGTLMADGAKVINPVRIAWWMLFFPAAYMGLLLLSLNFLGDGLRDAFDPRKGSKN